MDFEVVEKAVTRMADLLKVGFGTAGAAIINQNLTDAGELKVMQPGIKVRAIFGFCNIDKFSDALNTLHEDITVFVNSVAHIVHYYVESNFGSPNRNIGATFVIVWELPLTPGERLTDSSGGLVTDGEGAEGALTAVTAIVEHMQEVKALEVAGASFSQHGRQRDIDPRMAGSNSVGPRSLASSRKMSANFKAHRKAGHEILKAKDNQLRRCVRTMAHKINGSNYQGPDYGPDSEAWHFSMTFGLHCGWAIQGAIGSHTKIDASYLSPHVNIAARLGAANHQYQHVALLSLYLATLRLHSLPATLSRTRAVLVFALSFPAQDDAVWLTITLSPLTGRRCLSAGCLWLTITLSPFHTGRRF